MDAGRMYQISKLVSIGSCRGTHGSAGYRRGQARDTHTERPRRSTYHIVYQIDDSARVVHVPDIDHRSNIYRRPQQ